jgi:hypothetical protein
LIAATGYGNGVDWKYGVGMTWDDDFIFNAFHALMTATALLLHCCSEVFRLYGYGYDYMSSLFNNGDTWVLLFCSSSEYLTVEIIIISFRERKD